MTDSIKSFDLTPSRRPSVFRGAPHTSGLIIRPEQILALFRDACGNLPIPADAKFCGVGVVDEGSNSQIQFYFTSQSNPFEHCFQIPPHKLLKMLVGFADGLLPSDSELDGIEISPKWTVLLLRVKSDKFPPHPKDELPMIHLRYDLGQLYLADPSKAIDNEKRIRIQ